MYTNGPKLILVKLDAQRQWKILSNLIAKMILDNNSSYSYLSIKLEKINTFLRYKDREGLQNIPIHYE